MYNEELLICIIEEHPRGIAVPILLHSLSIGTYDLSDCELYDDVIMISTVRFIMKLAIKNWHSKLYLKDTIQGSMFGQILTMHSVTFGALDIRTSSMAWGDLHLNY